MQNCISIREFYQNKRCNSSSSNIVKATNLTFDKSRTDEQHQTKRKLINYSTLDKSPMQELRNKQQQQKRYPRRNSMPSSIMQSTAGTIQESSKPQHQQRFARRNSMPSLIQINADDLSRIESRCEDYEASMIPNNANILFSLKKATKSPLQNKSAGNRKDLDNLIATKTGKQSSKMSRPLLMQRQSSFSTLKTSSRSCTKAQRPTMSRQKSFISKIKVSLVQMNGNVKEQKVLRRNSMN